MKGEEAGGANLFLMPGLWKVVWLVACGYSRDREWKQHGYTTASELLPTVILRQSSRHLIMLVHRVTRNGLEFGKERETKIWIWGLQLRLEWLERTILHQRSWKVRRASFSGDAIYGVEDEGSGGDVR